MNVPIRLTPYVWMVKRVLAGRSSLTSASFKQDILCAEEREAMEPAISLPGQMDRVTGTASETTLANEFAEIGKTTAIHAPTIAYHIKSAVLFDGAVYAGPYRQDLNDPSFSEHADAEPRYVANAALASSYVGNRYFGHWLNDDCVTYILAESHSVPICTRGPYFAHRQPYAEYFGQNWSTTDRARFDRLTVFQDYAQNSLKRARYLTLRDRLQSRFSAAHANSFVYLRRGATGTSRGAANEEQILEALAAKGFLVIDVASTSLDEIIRTLMGAKIVVSMEGSHIAHCVLACPLDSGLIVLEPPQRFVAVHRGWTSSLGVKFGFVVGSETDAGVTYSASDILQTVDLMLKKMQ